VGGVEVECGVLGNEKPIASLPGEIVSHGFDGADWYDYSAKYAEGGMNLVVPPRLEQGTIERVQDLAVQAFVAGEVEGMARVDFFVRPDDDVSRARELMQQHKVQRILVCDDQKKPVGVISLQDLAKSEDEREVGETVQKVKEEGAAVH